MDKDQVKKMVKDKYSEIAADSKRKEQSSCCEPSNCCQSESSDYSAFNDDYTSLEGYLPEADLGLGCGLPTEYANIQKGDVVVDLGAGAGNDVFVARSLTGETGRVVGIDMTHEMIEKSNKNNQKLGYKNVEFILSDIENISLPEDYADVIISNCVLNLVPDKQKAFAEIFRVLKPGGHFCVSDVVLSGTLPQNLQKSAEMYAGCVAGALQKDEYLKVIKNTNFINVEVKKSKEIKLSDEVLSPFLSSGEISDFRKSGVGIFSITIFGYKKIL